MKNKLFQLLPVFTFLFAATFMSAQSNIDNSLASVNSYLEPIEYKSFELNKKSSTKSVTIPNEYEMISIDESKFAFKVSADFGSYVIPNTNYLKITAPDGKVYTKAQMSNKTTGKLIFNLSLDLNKSAIDMSNTKPGVYKLILTNKKGDIYAEDIMIM